MPSRQEIRSEETKRAILTAARKLFAERGFDAVTMRELAKEAGCSHTTIYIYFKDKEALLHQLSRGPLQSLHQQIESVLHNKTLSSGDRLKSITRTFIQFCFLNSNMYNILFMTKASRVDEEEPELEVQKLRNLLFGQLRRAIRECLPEGTRDPQVLTYARIYFYTLHGLIGTYTHSEETYDQLMERLGPTFDLAAEVMLAGFIQTVNRGADLT
jgi:AcrR family transcriptional regulator